MKSRLIIFLSVMLFLQGCVVDRRPVDTQFEDQAISIRVQKALREQPWWAQSNIKIYVLNGDVLLLGQTPEGNFRQQAITATNNVEGVIKVVDEMRVMAPLSLEEERQDSWISTKVNTRLATEGGIPPGRVKVVTENSEVFVIGFVTPEEATRVTEIARHVEGVSKVIRMFKVIE